MKFALLAILPAFVLAGCQYKLTLEEAQQRCMKNGGMLVLIYTQEITAAGPGEQIVSPGHCVLADKFDAPAPPPGQPVTPP